METTVEVNQHLENARVMRAAKQVLIEDGWTQGVLGSTGYPHCVLGAFRQAEGLVGMNEAEVFRSSQAVQAFARCIGRSSANGVYRWNDGFVETKAQVLATLEECAQREEAQAS